MRFLSVFLGSMLLLSSCSDHHFYQRAHELPDGNWSYSDTLKYEVEVLDTMSKYDLLLDIRHETDYAYQNIYVLIRTQFPDGSTTEQTLPIDFANSKGVWYGDCGSETCDLLVVLQEEVFFRQTGLYQFEIAQFMRTDPVEGILSVEMIIDRHKEATD